MSFPVAEVVLDQQIINDNSSDSFFKESFEMARIVSNYSDSTEKQSSNIFSGLSVKCD